MSDQNSTGNAGLRPEAVAERYGIKKATYYERTKFLKIKPEKGEDGKVYLSDKQVEMMDALNEHIKATGKMEGFTFGGGNETAPESVAQDTDDVNDNAESGKMTVAGKGKLSGASSVVEQEIPETQPDFSQGMEELIRGAAEIKAQNLAMPDLVKLQLASQMTYEDLPEDLQGRIDEVREAANPKSQPANIASQLLTQYRANRR